MDHEKETIDKMVTFIYFEAKEKINELKIKAVEDYNTEKSRLIKEASDREEINLKKQLEEIKTSRLKKLSDVKMQYKLKLAEKKLKHVNLIFQSAEKRLMNVRLSQNLITETLNAIEEDNLIAYVLPADSNRVTNTRISEIRDLNQDYFGGIIVTNSDESIIVDNSFKKRLETVRYTGMDKISKILFQKNKTNK